MSPPNSSQDIFDVRKIRRLAELMNEHDLSEINLREGDTRIQLRRGGEPMVNFAPRAVAAPTAASTTPAAPAADTPVDDKNIVVIKSPIVGTYYASPNPESPAFVKVGDHVSAESPVCIVEAMKVYNQVLAEVTGRITAILVENGQPVEFGHPLFKVDSRG